MEVLLSTQLHQSHHKTNTDPRQNLQGPTIMFHLFFHLSGNADRTYCQPACRHKRPRDKVPQTFLSRGAEQCRRPRAENISERSRRDKKKRSPRGSLCASVSTLGTLTLISRMIALRCCFPLLSVRVSASCTELSTHLKGSLFGQLFYQSLAQNLGKHPCPSNFGSHGGTHLQRYGDFTYGVALLVLVALPLFFFTPSPNPLNCVPASPESPSNQW